MTNSDHLNIKFMALAIQLARKGYTHPNPRVGCVIVKNGTIIGQGWHKKAGDKHAEINALDEAGGKAEGATVYVTLEPCAHFGKTPPCADALVKAKVAKVVIAMLDPNPLVAGKGSAVLQNAGIETVTGILEAEAGTLNPGFIKRMQTGLPFVRVKMATSLDGRTAMASGESKWITSPAARKDVQNLRARSAAVLTGSGTVLADNPELNIRVPKVNHQPLRVVLDKNLATPKDSRIISNAGKVVLFHSTTIPPEKYPDNVTLVTVGFDSSGLDLREILSWLGKNETNDVLVEAGSTLAGSFIKQGLCDELVVYMAPKLMGSTARPFLNLEINKMADNILLEAIDIRQVGEDFKLTLRPVATQ